jgi:hypothetical protein
MGGTRRDDIGSADAGDVAGVRVATVLGYVEGAVEGAVGGGEEGGGEEGHGCEGW